MERLTEKGLKKALLVKSDPANNLAILRAEQGVYSTLIVKPSAGVKSGGRWRRQQIKDC